jgi:protein SCO1/2
MLIYLFAFGLTSHGQQAAAPLASHCGGQHDQHQPTKPSDGKQGPAINMSDLEIELLDQDGKKVRFYSDLVKGKVVAINFLFTTCTTICPPLAATFSKLQSQMADRFGKDFYLISISVDPVTDTPERMKAWGAKFGRKEGWSFVTGKKSEMDKLLKALGAYSSRKEDHTPMVIIGNDSAGVWTRAYGLAPASKLSAVIAQMIGGQTAEPQMKEMNKK